MCKERSGNTGEDGPSQSQRGGPEGARAAGLALLFNLYRPRRLFTAYNAQLHWGLRMDLSNDDFSFSHMDFSKSLLLKFIFYLSYSCVLGGPTLPQIKGSTSSGRLTLFYWPGYVLLPLFQKFRVFK